ncbi:MAG: hypothetical protein K2N42_03460, partial [Anaeroplasmataceae bacterium]|nr:hypothetical protein [Anaeroplasmataceae bacterium]
MEKYILLKTEKENFPYIIDVFHMLVGSTAHIEEKNDVLKIKCKDIELKEIEATIESLEGDLNALITSYQTTSLKPNKEISLIEEAFKEMSYGHYQFKSFVLNVKKKELALELFQFITEGSGVTEDIILAMADCDLNVSKASNLLY